MSAARSVKRAVERKYHTKLDPNPTPVVQAAAGPHLVAVTVTPILLDKVEVVNGPTYAADEGKRVLAFLPEWGVVQVQDIADGKGRAFFGSTSQVRHMALAIPKPRPEPPAEGAGEKLA